VMVWLEVLVACVCAVGIVGTIVPIIPGAALCAAAIVVWAIAAGGYAWWVALAAVAIVVAGAVLKYLIPGRRLKAQGVPGVVLLAGGVLGIVGFFVIPVVGLVIGFVLGVYLAEWWRLKSPAQAWPTTLAAMKAAGVSTLIELASAMLATGLWVAAATTAHLF